MAYITPAQLATGPDALLELSQLLAIEDPALLRATIDGADRSAWTAPERAAADAALATLTAYIGRSDGEIDARLAHRGYSIPQSPVSFPVLVVWAAAITRYHLSRMRDRTTEETGRIERDYRDAIRALQLVADGKLSLGANDPLAAAQQTEPVQMESAERMFTRESLRGL